MTDAARIQSLADALLAAERTRSPCARPTDLWAGLTRADAYAIQAAGLAARAAQGRSVVGRKIGFPTRSVQRAAQTDRPMHGAILSDRVYGDGMDFAADTFFQPRLETELAFVLGRDLAGPGIQVHDVLTATETVCPALEIVDTRLSEPPAALDAVSDNGLFGALILGGRPIRPFDEDLRRVGATVARNGDIEDSGLGAALLGHPAASIAWLVNTLAEDGTGLKSGDIVIGGSFTTPRPVRPGDVFSLDYGALGTLSVRFS